MTFDRATLDALLAPVLRWIPQPPLVTVIRLSGLIGRSGPGQGALSLAGLAGAIEQAFKPKRLAAVALAVNSPGGAPAQSSLIAGRIRQLADERKIPVLAFVEDVAASGGYWLALAADEIFADEASLIGSIGVVSAGFGFPDLLRRVGVERRVHAQGARKAMLDPFQPEKDDEVARLLALQAEVHALFKDQVRRRRGDRLTVDAADLFEGDVWTGRRAVELGLIDGIGDLRSVMRARFGDKVKFRVVGERQGWLRRQLGLTATATPVDGLLAGLEERATWARFGL